MAYWGTRLPAREKPDENIAATRVAIGFDARAATLSRDPVIRRPGAEAMRSFLFIGLGLHLVCSTLASAQMQKSAGRRLGLLQGG
jgi:hypothetical protein